MHIGKPVVFCILINFGIAVAREADKFDELARSFYYQTAEYNPVWGTKAGIHTFDSLLPDISDGQLRKHSEFLKRSKALLAKIDTSGWTADRQIDFLLLKSDMEFMSSDLRQPYLTLDSLINYPAITYDAVYDLMARQYPPFADRSSALRKRIDLIPDFLRKAMPREDTITWDNRHCAEFDAQGGQALISGISEVLIDSFPEDNAKIATARDRAGIAFLDYYQRLGKLKILFGDHPIGKEKFNSLLTEYYFLDIDIDSVKTIAETICKEADSLMKVYAKTARDDYPWSPHDDVFGGPPIDSVMRYCYAELDSIGIFLNKNEIVTVPDNLSECLFVSAESTGLVKYDMTDFYFSPGNLDQDQTGVYYTGFHMLTTPLFAEMPYDYAVRKNRRGFARLIIPGEHMQAFISHNHKSIVRRMQENDMMKNGWTLYINELLAHRGLYGDNPVVLRDIYNEIRTYAVEAVVDIARLCDGYPYDSTLAIKTRLFGADYPSRQRSYHGYLDPMENLSYVLGYFMLRDMKAKASAKEEKDFNLKDFHDKVLSEGCIPPALIARKYGW